jgi:glycosyltransferase involved in cell wall biosynthesis
MAQKPDISMIVTAHREGILAHPSLRSLSIAIEHAVQRGLHVEVVAVLDKPDAITSSTFEEALGVDGHLGRVASTKTIVSDFGDPGLARNEGVAAAAADVVGFFDSDNLMSSNWIWRAFEAVTSDSSDLIIHPDYTVAFEGKKNIWQLVGSKDERFRAELLYQFNYWDAFAMARKSIYERFPFEETRAEWGFGHEDWAWNCVTCAAGIEHRTVAETVLFYRVKNAGSRLQIHEQEESILAPNPLLISGALARSAELNLLTEPTNELAVVRALADSSRGPVSKLIRSVASGKPSRSGLFDAALRSFDERTSGGEFSRRAKRLLKQVIRRSPVIQTREFDADQYRLRYSDLSKASAVDAYNHFLSFGRAEGRHGRLTRDEVTALRPDVFDPDHYRIRYPDIALMSRAQATEHYLALGITEGRVGRLAPIEIDALAPSRFNAEQYRLLYPDLENLSEQELVAHYLSFGRVEARRGVMTVGEFATIPQGLAPWMADAWRAAHQIDPWIPMPTKASIAEFRLYASRWHEEFHPAAVAYWKLIEALPPRVDYVFIAPWVRLGGGDLVLLRYIKTVRELSPDASVVLFTTDPLGSTHLDLVAAGVIIINLRDILSENQLTPGQEERILATALVQHRPHTIHVVNSSLGFDAVDRYGRAIARNSQIFLSTFVIERSDTGEIASWMTKRKPEFLDFVSAVVVDHQAIASAFWELYRFDQSKFVVHHQAVSGDLIPRDAALRNRDRPVRILWAARFDRQKRIDILALVAERLAERNVRAEIHFYGESVMDADAGLTQSLERLEAVGAVRHPPYSGGFSSLPIGSFDVFLMTSEWEGIPLLLLDAMTSGLPVVAPMVGGIAEVLSEERGYPVTSFDAIDEYVDQIVKVHAEVAEAEKRAASAHIYMKDNFSWESFTRAIADTPGYLL